MSWGIRKRKAEFKRRAKAMGLWPRFVQERERLKREGFDPEDVVYTLIPAFEKVMDERVAPEFH